MLVSVVAGTDCLDFDGCRASREAAFVRSTLEWGDAGTSALTHCRIATWERAARFVWEEQYLRRTMIALVMSWHHEGCVSDARIRRSPETSLKRNHLLLYKQYELF